MPHFLNASFSSLPSHATLAQLVPRNRLSSGDGKYEILGLTLYQMSDKEQGNE